MQNIVGSYLHPLPGLQILEHGRDGHPCIAKHHAPSRALPGHSDQSSVALLRNSVSAYENFLSIPVTAEWLDRISIRTCHNQPADVASLGTLSSFPLPPWRALMSRNHSILTRTAGLL